MLIGASQVNITPKVPFPLQGRYDYWEGSELLDPLYASCVVLDDEETQLVFISCDLISIPEDSVSEIRAKIYEKTGIGPGNIMISATHTHQGPIMTDNKGLAWKRRDLELYRKVLDGIVLSAVEAYGNRKPGKVGYGRSTLEKCGYNRRYIMSDGRSRMELTSGPNPHRLMVEGPVDREIQVVWFEDLEGNYISLMVNYSCHPISLIRTHYVSADFPGAMRQDLQKLLGDHVPVLYLQGACGNVWTRDVEREDGWGVGLDGYRRMGRIMAGEVVKIVSSSRAGERRGAVLRAECRKVQIPYNEISPEEVARIKKEWEGLSQEERESLPFERKVYCTRVMNLERLRKKSDSYPIEVCLFKVDDIFFASNPSEYFVEYQLELKRRHRGKKIMVMELTNGAMGYIPTKQAIALGGYETICPRFSKEAGTMILDEWSNMIES